MLALVAYSLKPVKLLGPCKRTQHCWPTTPNNVLELLALVASVCMGLNAESFDVQLKRLLTYKGWKNFSCYLSLLDLSTCLAAFFSVIENM